MMKMFTVIMNYIWTNTVNNWYFSASSIYPISSHINCTLLLCLIFCLPWQIELPYVCADKHSLSAVYEIWDNISLKRCFDIFILQWQLPQEKVIIFKTSLCILSCIHFCSPEMWSWKTHIPIVTLRRHLWTIVELSLKKRQSLLSCYLIKWEICIPHLSMGVLCHF
jgi:hypothetical protein